MAVATSTAILIGVAVAAAAGTAYSVHEQNMATKTMATAQARDNAAQAAQLKMQAEAEKAQAQADELDRQQTLKRVLAAQTAVFGATGFDPMSTSFANIQSSDVQREAQSKNLNQVFTDTRQIGIQNNIRSLDFNTQTTFMGAKFARRANTINGINSVIQMGGSMYAAGAGGKK